MNFSDCENRNPNSLTVGQRCYFLKGPRVAFGRIVRCLVNADGTFEYEVLTGTRIETVNESDVCSYSPGKTESGKCLGARMFSDPWTYYSRLSYIRSGLKQYLACKGLICLLQSRTDVYPHQVNAVKTILGDPVKRYLLADEVGLGKTVEALYVAKQCVLQGYGSVAVFVPSHLRDQWVSECARLFALKLNKDVFVLSHFQMKDELPKSVDLIIIDEAHLIVDELYESASNIAVRYKKLLLLTANPAKGGERTIFRLLHLLDPQANRLSEEGIFRHKVDKRRQIAEFLAVFEPGMSRASLRRGVSELRRLLSDTAEVEELADRIDALCEKTDFDSQAADKLVCECRRLVADKYRIYRRMIRNSRKQLGDGFRFGRSPQTDLVKVSVEGDSSLLYLVEEWRLAAVSAERTDLLDLYLRFAVACMGPAEDLAVLVRERLCDERLFAGEPELLSRVLDATELADHSWCQQLAEALLALPGNRSNVIFASSPVARALIRRALIERHFKVLEHSAETPEKAGQVSSEFTGSDRRVCLICDPSARVGLNLQTASTVVLVDLPYDVAAIEQQIGRCDRLGRNASLSILVLRHGDPSSPHDAWLDVLERGLGIFHRSVADVEFEIQKFVVDLKEVVFRSGPDGLRGGVESLVKRISEERNNLIIQDSLDSIERVGGVGEVVCREMKIQDEECESFKKAFDDWNVKILKLNSLETRGLIELSVDSHFEATGLWYEEISKSIEGHKAIGTFTRHPLMSVYPIDVLNQGHPLLDKCLKYALWEDLGRVCCFWRVILDLPPQDEQLVFKFDFGGPAELGGKVVSSVVVDANGERLSNQLERAACLPFDYAHDLDLGDDFDRALGRFVSLSLFPSVVDTARSRAGVGNCIGAAAIVLSHRSPFEQ